jgi:hypothetical protein
MDKEREHLKNLELNSSHGGSSLGVDASKIQLEAPVFIQNKQGKINKKAKNKTDLKKDSFGNQP